MSNKKFHIHIDAKTEADLNKINETLLKALC
jgi:hypothetical protein